MAPPSAPNRSNSHREITASKAGIYTNIYSGPTATLEFSMLAERIEAMSTAAEATGKAVKALRTDVDGLKARGRGGTPMSDIGGFGPFAPTFASDEHDRGLGLGDLRCAPLPACAVVPFAAPPPQKPSKPAGLKRLHREHSGSRNRAHADATRVPQMASCHWLPLTQQVDVVSARDRARGQGNPWHGCPTQEHAHG